MAFNRTLGHFTSSQDLATQWASGQSYILNQLVLDNDKLYRCILAHTSGATFAGDSAYWTLVNSFDSIAPTTTAGDIIVHNGTDNVRQGIGSDGQVLVVDTAQTNKLKWATIQQGSKNYIANSTFENGVTPPSSWSTVSVTIDATTKIPSGSTSADATITLATSSSSPLAGTYSMLATTAGTTTITTTARGFISSAFTIDAEDKAKVMGFSFYYEPSGSNMNFSGTSANTFAVYIRDVSGGAWIQPAGVYNMTQGSGSGLCSGTFQTTATGTQYQIAVFMINTVTGALSIKFDDFQLGPQKVVYGSPITDWQSYTPTITNFGPPGSVTVKAYYRRVGANIEVNADFLQSANFGSSTGAVTVDIIGNLGLAIDSSKLATNTTGFGHIDGVAYAVGYAAGETSVGRIEQNFSSSSIVRFMGDDGATQWNTATSVPSVWAAATQNDIRIAASIPIQGWSSSVQMSNDTDTRVVAARYTATSGTVSALGIINFSNRSIDTHSSVTTGASWKFTAPVSGVYKVDLVLNLGSTSAASTINAYLYKNNAQEARFKGDSQAPTGGNSTERSAGGSILVQLNAGEFIDIRASSSTSLSISAGTGETSVSVHMLSGPATIAASESVNCKYGSLSGYTLGNVDGAIFSAPIKIFDSHSAYNPATGYTVPVSGKYLVNLQFVTQNYNTNSTIVSRLQLNGATFSSGTVVVPGGVSGQWTGSRVGLINANAGDIIKPVLFSTAGSPALTVVTFDNYIEIVRIGN
jgi:hypothetical protein